MSEAKCEGKHHKQVAFVLSPFLPPLEGMKEGSQ